MWGQAKRSGSVQLEVWKILPFQSRTGDPPKSRVIVPLCFRPDRQDGRLRDVSELI